MTIGEFVEICIETDVMINNNKIRSMLHGIYIITTLPELEKKKLEALDNEI